MNIILRFIILYLFLTIGNIYSQCGPGTPSFTVNMVGSPTGTYTSPVIQRNDTCCGSTAPDVCLKFTIILDPNAMGINFGIASGAVPPGALFYQINCGPPIAVGTPICLSGPGPHILTFCKPGNNNNTYSISSIPAPVVPDSILVRSGCTSTLAVTGFSVPTINWNSVAPGLPGAYNSYLSCTSGCASVVVTPSGTPPTFVDYEVSGFGQSPCQANFFKDTIRVYFFNDLIATINPTLTTICFGQTNAVLTGSASGGLPAYTYSWSTGSTAPTVTVGPGTYTFIVNDKTGCPPTTATAVVNSFTLPIIANAGPDQIVCKVNPNVALSGTVTSASGGLWSGGSGTFTPSTTTLSPTYIPTPGEITSGSVQLYLTTTGNQGCPPDQDTIKITFQNVSITSPGPASTVCANNNVVNLSGSVSGFTNTGQWSTSGTGTFVSLTNLNTQYTPSAGDISAGTVTITLTSTNNGSCPPATSSVVITITPAPLVNAGIGQSICSTGSATLNGSVSAGATTGVWTTSGSGVFNPSSSTLNASYLPSASDVAAGTVTLTLTSTNNGNCFPVQDTIIINIKQIASVNAGPNLALCSNSGSISLTGNVSGGTTTGIWSSSGTGGYNPNNTTLNTAYNITPADILAGSVTFTLNSTNNGVCPVVSDTVKISITTLAVVNAGPNQSICSNAAAINLNGSITGVSGTGVWTSSGSGSYNPNNTTLNAAYNMSAGDISAGSVTFTLTSLNNGPCPAVTDSVRVNIGLLATVNAGPNLALCSNAGTVSLSGSVNGVTTSGFWTSSGNGGYNPNNTSLITSYNIVPTDITNGSVTFTLTSSNNGPCPAVTDTVMVSITSLATVNAGSNQTICSSAGLINLNGLVTGVSGFGIWTSSGGGAYNPNNITLNASYSITPTDISNGFVTFTLTSLNNGPCPAVSDSVRIRITTIASVNAGPSKLICSNTGTIALNGTIAGSTSTGVWTTNGIGPFVPGSTSLNNSYFITVSDVAAGVITFTLSSTNNGVCPAVSDTLQVTIKQVATAYAGPNQILCANTSAINLSGVIGGGSSTGIWSASGTGSFVPDNITLNTSYSITPADINLGSVTFTLASTNNGACPAILDSVKISIKRLAIVNAGADINICSTTLVTPYSGSVSVGSSTGVWNTSGSGSFSPNTTSLNGFYTISPQDIANGTVYLILTSTNNGVCPAVSDTAILSIIKKPVITINSDTTVCAYGNQFVASANLSGGSGNLQWTSSGTGFFSPQDFLNPVTYNFSPADITSGSVILTFNSVNNGACGNSSATMNITVRPVPVANFSASTYTAYIPNDPITFTNLSTNANSYYWYFGDGSFSNFVNPVHTYFTVGYYYAGLIATSQYGCKDTTEQLITIISNVQFPNVFTPNTSGPNGGSYNIADLSNDVFFPYTSGVTDYSLMIFNRWGELIFESKDINIGWDGYFNGKLCQQDAYVWKANISFFDGRKYNKTGSVTLLR